MLINTPKKIKERVILGEELNFSSKNLPRNAPPTIGNEIENPNSVAKDNTDANLFVSFSRTFCCPNTYLF